MKVLRDNLILEVTEFSFMSVKSNLLHGCERTFFGEVSLIHIPYPSEVSKPYRGEMKFHLVEP